MITKVINEKEISTETDQKIKQGLCICFPDNYDFFSTSRAWNGVSPEFSVVGFENGDIVAHAGVIRREILIGDSTKLTIFGLQNVFVLPEFRGKSLLTPIMHQIEESVNERNFDCGLLFCKPKLEKVYSKYSWKKLSNRVIRIDENGQATSLKEKDIAMFFPLIISNFPKGNINLQGREW